jgi:uncharacterized protein YdhG (YjbR/CyaY superfamily)
MPEKYATVEDYLATQPPEVRAVLEDVRRIAHQVVPGGEDAISYDIASLTLHGRTVVHYAGWKKHVSLYPVPEGDADLQRDLAPYLSGSSTLKVPLSEPLPESLVARMVEALLAERHTPA